MDFQEGNQATISERFRLRIEDAKRLGFEVRLIPLETQAPGWCLVDGKPVLFIDLKATTADQFAQISEILADFSSRRAA